MLIDVASGSAARNPSGAVSALSSANYSVTGCEFRLLQEMPPKTQLANMDYCFTSYDLFNDTIPQSTTRHNQEITSVSSKAMALFTTFEDQRYNSGIQSLGSNSYFTGIAADAPGFNINSVVYFINNKLYPLRAYDPKRNHDKVIQVNELVKALSTLGFAPKNLGNTDASNGNIQANRFLLARELARGDMVYNLQNAEPQLRIGFSGARGNDAYHNARHNTTMRTFVFSKKIIHIDGADGLTLEF